MSAVDVGAVQSDGLGTPTITDVAAGDEQNTITFSAVAGATGYNLYWKTSATVTKLNGTLITGVTSPYQHTGLSNSTTYYYVATAEDDESESDESNEDSGTPQAGASPSPTLPRKLPIIRDRVITLKEIANTTNEFLGDSLVGWKPWKAWTPTITFSTAGDLSVAYTTQSGKYLRYGKRALVSFLIQTSTFTHTTASGNLQILSPLTGSTGTQLFSGNLIFQGITKANYTSVSIVPVTSQTYFLLKASGSGQNIATIGASDMPTTGTVILQGFIEYEITWWY